MPGLVLTFSAPDVLPLASFIITGHINLLNARLLHAEISTKVCICWGIKCILYLISPQPMTIAPSFITSQNIACVWWIFVAPACISILNKGVLSVLVNCCCSIILMVDQASLTHTARAKAIYQQVVTVCPLWTNNAVNSTPSMTCLPKFGQLHTVKFPGPTGMIHCSLL